MPEPTRDTFAIIVPFIKVDGYLLECVAGCLALDYPAERTELVLLPDGELDPAAVRDALPEGADKARFDRIVRVLTTGPVKPGKKRNMGMKSTQAEFYACIDADAYPDPGWLKNALPFLTRTVR